MSGRGEALTPESEATLRALAEAQVGRCHRCAYLRQEHRDDMGHRPESKVGVRAEDVIALLDENALLRAALEGIADYRRPWHAAETDPDAIAACARCQGYRDHPIQRGICDEHRRPFWKAEADNDAEVRRTEGVLKGIAREALRARGAGR